MKHILIRSIIPIFLSVMLAIACRTSNTGKMEKQIDGILSKYNGADLPGASVAVMQNDSIIFRKGYGLSNIQTGERITPSSNFRLASVTKQFTAMTIMMLAEQGKLSLEDSLRRYFPDFPAYGKDIRIRHLLTHTSGLVDYEDLIPKTLSRQVYDTDCLKLMHETDSLYFPAGSRYRYSNTGYALLSLITEKVSGQPFAKFLNDSIFKPLGMQTSVAYEEGVSTVQNRAFGHSFRNNEWVQTDQSQTSAVLGDGGIYSNPGELATWISALWNHRLIKAELQNKAWSKALLNDGTSIGYGFGLHLDGPDSHPHHDGSTMGFRNHILVYPEKKMMVVLLTNRNDAEPRAEAEKIAALF